MVAFRPTRLQEGGRCRQRIHCRHPRVRHRVARGGTGAGGVARSEINREVTAHGTWRTMVVDVVTHGCRAGARARRSQVSRPDGCPCCGPEQKRQRCLATRRKSRLCQAVGGSTRDASDARRVRVDSEEIWALWAEGLFWPFRNLTARQREEIETRVAPWLQARVCQARPLAPRCRTSKETATGNDTAQEPQLGVAMGSRCHSAKKDGPPAWGRGSFKWITISDHNLSRVSLVGLLSRVAIGAIRAAPAALAQAF